MGMKKRLPSTPTSAQHTTNITSENTDDTDTHTITLAAEKRKRGSSTGIDIDPNTNLSGLGLPIHFTLAGIVAYLHTALYVFFGYCRHLDRVGHSYLDHLGMGLTSWLSSERVDGNEGDGNEEMTEMKAKTSTKSQATEVKRRRHQAGDRGTSRDRDNDAVYYPGMVNLSGTLCYMNSVLQAFASVTSLLTHLEKIVNLAVDVDLPTPVADALLEILYDLNTPQKRQPPALRPVALLHALQTLPAIRRLLSTREQQDAHELFLVLAEAVSDEAVKVAAEVAITRGFGEILSLQGYIFNKDKNKESVSSGASTSSTMTSATTGTGGTLESGRLGQDGGRATRAKKRGLAMPWEGLMARRRVCKRCGWCESIRMDTLGGMELAIPLNGEVSVENCIAQYLAPELLSDVTCEMCSLRQTLAHYTVDAERLATPSSSITSGTPRPSGASTKSGSFSPLEHVRANTNGIEENGGMTSSRKKKAKEAKRTEARLKEMLDSGTITNFGESLIPTSMTSASGLGSVPGSGGVPVKWQTVRTDSVREAAITRPPQSLRLHFIRSEYTPYGQLMKKSARVAFPMILDLTRFVANGVWEERNVLGMLGTGSNSNTNTNFNSDNGTNGGKATTDTPAPQARVLYRLESVILHYGYNHSSGHYICIRRKPRPAKNGEETNRPTPVSKSCPDGCRCDACSWFGQVRSQNQDGGGGDMRGKGWLRISDADVDEVGVEALLDAQAAVFMVFYEKVGEYQGGEGDGMEINGVVREQDQGVGSRSVE